MNSFMNFMGSLYLHMKSVRLGAVFAWMAAMSFLPMLLGHHAQAGVATPQGEAFKAVKCRLLDTIINPAMAVIAGFGIWMVAYRNETPGWWVRRGDYARRFCLSPF